jgi:hypothetical protein
MRIASSTAAQVYVTAANVAGTVLNRTKTHKRGQAFHAQDVPIMVNVVNDKVRHVTVLTPEGKAVVRLAGGSALVGACHGSKQDGIMVRMLLNGSPLSALLAL